MMIRQKGNLEICPNPPKDLAISKEKPGNVVIVLEIFQKVLLNVLLRTIFLKKNSENSPPKKITGPL
jgi:hypothetical protein